MPQVAGLIKANGNIVCGIPFGDDKRCFRGCFRRNQGCGEKGEYEEKKTNSSKKHTTDYCVRTTVGTVAGRTDAVCIKGVSRCSRPGWLGLFNPSQAETVTKW